MKLLFTLFLSVVFSVAGAQTFEELGALNAGGNAAQAMVQAKKLLNEDTTAVFAYEVVGEAYFSMKQYDSAIHYFTRGIKHDNDHTYISGWCHAYLGDYDMMQHLSEVAISEFHKAMSNGMKPECIALSAEKLGELYWQRSKYDSAKYYLQKAVEADNDTGYISAKAHEWLGFISAQKTDYTQALAEYDKIIRLNKDSTSIRTANDGRLDALYGQRKYDEAKQLGYKMMQQYPADPCPSFTIAHIYSDRDVYDSTLYYSQKAISLDSDRTYRSAWTNIYMAKAYMHLGDKDKAINAFNTTVALGKTRNSVSYAKRMLDSLGYKPPRNYVSTEPDWVIIEGEHIRYYFQDTAGLGYRVNRYIKAHEKAYEKINEIFHATLPQKMVFYVWLDRDLAKQLLGHELGFTNPGRCITNAAIDQTVGHEMTHTLSYWGWDTPPVQRTRLINEGVAVAFDLENDDKYQSAQMAVAGKNIHSVMDIWKNEDNADVEVLYPVGGAFITYLYGKSTQEQFKALIKDQAIENAKKIYGKAEFDKLVTDFDKLIGMDK